VIKRQFNVNLAVALLLCCVLGLVASCGQSGLQQQLDTYLTRLANTLDAELSLQAIASTPKPPKTSDLRLDLPSANLGALDFLSLTGCEVQITIGKRNSSLGKLAKDSQRLLLELEFLQYAPACIRYLRTEGRPELANTLQSAYQLKQGQLPGLIFNATLANIEYREFWSSPGQLSDYPAQTSSAVLSALEAVNAQVARWLAGDYRADNRGFEVLLSEVAKGDGGALLKALALQSQHLDAANRVLDNSLTSGPLCTDRYRAPAADILPTVVHKYFIAGVQPWSASLGRRYHELIPAIEALEEVLQEALPNIYLDWRATRRADFAHLTAAPAAHVALIQQVMVACEER